MRVLVDTLPVSVINIAPGARRANGGHDAQSSRMGFSGFPVEVGAICAQLFLRDSLTVFDPFAGWGERARAITSAGKQYIGFDTSPDAIAYADKTFGAVNVLANSLHEPIPQHDGLLTCPPYFNLERYAGDGIDKTPSFDGFCARLERVFLRCFLSSTPGATWCVQVGDWRSKGVYFDLTHRTRSMLYGIGLDPLDECVVSRLNISKVKIMIPQAVRFGYTVKVHETLLVFRKP